MSSKALGIWWQAKNVRPSLEGQTSSSSSDFHISLPGVLGSPTSPVALFKELAPNWLFLTPPHSESSQWTLKKFRQGEGLFGLKVQGRHRERFGGGQWAGHAWRQER